MTLREVVDFRREVWGLRLWCIIRKLLLHPLLEIVHEAVPFGGVSDTIVFPLGPLEELRQDPADRLGLHALQVRPRRLEVVLATVLAAVAFPLHDFKGLGYDGAGFG
jgi:hypothetical protein